MAAERWRNVAAHSPASFVYSFPSFPVAPSFSSAPSPSPATYTYKGPIPCLSTSTDANPSAFSFAPAFASVSKDAHEPPLPTHSNLKRLFGAHVDLDDRLLDECIHLLIERWKRTDILYISSVDLAFPIVRWDPDAVVRHFGSKQPDWKYIIIPINKRPFPPPKFPVSTHWSLLIIAKRNPLRYRGYHYDSSANLLNEPDANHLCKLLGEGLLSDDPERGSGDIFTPFCAPFYIQPGGYECGYYVVLAVYMFLKYGIADAHDIYRENEWGFATYFDEMCTFIK